MQSIRQAFTVPIAGSTLDTLQNTNLSHAPRPSIVVIYGVQETAVDDIEIEVFAGARSLIARGPLPLRAGAGPNKPDDQIGSGFVGAGEKIQVNLYNTDAAAARVARLAVDLQPIA